MMAGSPNIHGEKIIDSLRIEAFCIELSQRGGSVTESACGLLHVGLFTENNRTALAVTLDVKMSSEAIECGFDLVVQSILGDPDPSMMPSTLGSWKVH